MGYKEPPFFTLVLKGEGLRSFTNVVLDIGLYSASQKYSLEALTPAPLLKSYRPKCMLSSQLPGRGCYDQGFMGMLSEQLSGGQNPTFRTEGRELHGVRKPTSANTNPELPQIPFSLQAASFRIAGNSQVAIKERSKVGVSYLQFK